MQVQKPLIESVGLHAHNWEDTNPHEMKAYLSFLIYVGFVDLSEMFSAEAFRCMLHQEVLLKQDNHYGFTC